MKHELETRIATLSEKLSQADADYDTALIVGRVNQYYLTGTMQDALFILKRDGSAYLFVKKSYERACLECPLDIVHPMTSYRDVLSVLSSDFGNTFIDADVVPVSLLERLKKYFSMESVNPLDRILLEQRSVKSASELALLIQAGEAHRRLLEDVVPTLLVEGISEAEFHGELLASMMKLGHQGLSRLNMFQAESIAGQLGFGDSSLFPTSFDGPGGMKGMSPASPGAGNRERRLEKGDLVFVDVCFGVDGYHTDKTQVYSFGKEPDGDVLKVHRACLGIETRCGELMAAGAIPSEIYAHIMDDLPEELSHGFMGYTDRVRFLGHGIGLNVDEMPVIARGFNDPLKENMIIALEPKCGLSGIGTVGVEDTYVVKAERSECITGGGRDIITLD